eukprot:804498-Prorocentrum_minimum.AAC.1
MSGKGGTPHAPHAGSSPGRWSKRASAHRPPPPPSPRPPRRQGLSPPASPLLTGAAPHGRHSRSRPS